MTNDLAEGEICDSRDSIPRRAIWGKADSRRGNRSAERISRKFLESILLTLKNNGVLESKRGKGGGYLLREPPDQITIGQIIRIVDGPLSPVSCVSRTAYRPCSDCPDEATCRIRLVMKEVREAISKVLDLKTVAALAEEGKQPRDKDWFMVGI